MKKKFFTLITLLCTLVGGAKAADTDNVLIKTIDFTGDAWADCRTAGKFTNDDGIVDGCTASADLAMTAIGEMNFNSSNMSTSGANALIIPLDNIYGSIKIVVTSTSANVRFNWYFAEGDDACANRYGTAKGVTTVNYTMSTTATTGTLYMGRRGSTDEIAITKIQIYTADASSVADPTISFTSPDVTITCPTVGAAIYYTLDGTDPTDASTLYSAPFSISEDKVVKAIAYKNGNHSEIVSKYCGLDKIFSTTTLVRFDDGNFVTPASATIEGITFGAGTTYSANSGNVDGLSFTAGVQFDGGSYNINRFISFKVAAACKIFIYGTSNSGDVRYVNVKEGEMPEGAEDGTLVGTNASGYTDMSLYECGNATTVYITPRSGKNYRIFAIKIVFGNENEYTLNIGSTGFATLSLPYAVSIPSGIKAYTGAVGATSIALTEITDGIIPANTGVIVGGEAGSYTFSETTSVGTAASELGSTAGEGLDVSGSSDTFYVLSKQNDKAAFAKVTNEDYKVIPANKAYVCVAAGGAPVLDIDFNNGNTTGINAVNGSEVMINSEFYNLNGQRVAQPTKGLYIVNGKKYIVK